MKTRYLIAGLLTAALVGGIAFAISDQMLATRSVAEPSAPPDPQIPDVEVVRQIVPPVIADDTEYVTAEFAVNNPGSVELKLAAIRKSCSCSDAELASLTVSPGGSTTLRVRLATAGRSRLQRVTCTVEDTTGRTRVYELETTLYRRVLFGEPVYHFGFVYPGTRPEKPIEVTFAGLTEAELPTQVTFTTDVPALTIGPTNLSTERRPDGMWVRRARTTATLSSPSEPGAAGATVTVAYRIGDTQGRTETVPVDWHGRSRFQVSPPQISLTAADWSAGSVVRRITLRRLDGLSVPVKAVRTPSESLRAQTTSGAGGEAVIALTVTPGGDPGFTYGELVIETGFADEPTVIVPVAAFPK